MSVKRRYGGRLRHVPRWSWRTRGLLMALAVVALGVAASSAAALTPQIEIVSQSGPPAGPIPRNVHYFTTIQAAVDATKPHSWVLIEPGVYKEEVKVEKPHSDIWIRGMNRNTVVLDGEGLEKPGGSNGIEVYKDSHVWIENLTAENFNREYSEGPGGNEIWWNGGEDSEKIGARGWYGRYLTAYDTGLNGGYGIFTNNETEGEWENIYSSGMNDSGIYLGACQECEARINKATMEYNALGYSGSNSGGNLIIENSVFNHNTDGFAPNSETPGDGPPPQNGACEHRKYNRKSARPKLPSFSSTDIAHCTIFRNNKVEENDDLNAPDNPSSAAAPWGAGVELPGDYGDLIEHNTIKNNPTDGVLAFEYPNPYPPTAETIVFQLAGNKIVDNTFSGNGYVGGAYAGDIMMGSSEIFGEAHSTNNCVEGNSYTAATYPENIETTWGCDKSTTPSPNLGYAGILYLVELQAISEGRTPEPQPAPPAQESMADPCEGVPTNPLCE